MTASAVYDALHDAIDTDNNIDIWAAATTSDALTELVGVLHLFGITASYTLNKAQLTRGTDTVNLNANGVFGQPGAPDDNRYPISAALVYIDNGEDGEVFTLTFTFTGSKWSFSGFFNTLPQCRRMVNINETHWTDSFLIGISLSHVAFSARSGDNQLLHLSGFLPEAQVFEPYSAFIGPWPLRVYGPLTMPATWQDTPLMELVALAGPGSNIGITNDVPGGQGPNNFSITDIGLRLAIRDGLELDIWGRVAFSTLELMGTLTVLSLKADLSAPLLTSDSLWSMIAAFRPESASLVEGMSQLTTLFGMPALPLPDNFPGISSFKFREIELYLKLPTTPGQSAVINNLAITIVSDNEWTPPVPFVTITNLGTRWVWAWSTYTDERGTEVSKSMVTGSVFGTLEFGGDSTPGGSTPPPALPSPPDSDQTSAQALTTSTESGNTVHIDVSLMLPSLFIGGNMRQGDYIPIGKAFTQFFGAEGPNTIANMNITGLQFNADPIGQNYSAGAEIIFGDPANPTPGQGWKIPLVVIDITLEQLSFYINANGGVITGGIYGEFLLIQDANPNDIEQPRILVSADYPVQDPQTPDGWIFHGYLYPGTSIDLIKLVTRFLNINADNTSAPVSLTVDAIDIQFSTGSQAYHLAGTISTRWSPKIFDTQLRISASASVAINKPAGQDKASGQLSGSFSINKISLLAMMDVGVKEANYLFRVQFEQLWIQAVTFWRGEDPNRHQVLSVQLGGVTLGDILEYLVNLAAPTLGYKLEPPWDVLKQVDLSRFVLTLDPQDNIVEFVFNANVDLVVMRLDSIGVRYTKDGGEGKVNMILTGNFLGESYDSNKPLSWDVINDPPPAVPGGGESFVNLRYLGLGQRVTFKGKTPDTVAQSISQLRQDMQPPKDPNKSPLDGQGVGYSSDSQWLIGLDIQLIETIDLGFIFNDPKLYGLSIALGGERAGTLSGLHFEILYKKITNDIGMFRIEFQLPDAFRTFEVGVASFTLGIVVIEIYTNGNFKIDLGFPYNRNFDRAFNVQAEIFIGRGGFYLGVLNGDTSSQVPRITNGNFSPVIELGIGLAVGVGREIREGILAGGAYIEIEVLFQGVLGWFNPNSSGTAPAKFFKCQGIAALHGKVYGSVDFAVIKVSVTLDAYAQASVIYEVYQATLFELSVSVSAKAKVKILFVHVSFSFHVGLELEFTLGSAQATPWILAGNGQGSQNPPQLMTTAFDVGVTATPRQISQLRQNKHRRRQVLRNEHISALYKARLKSGSMESLKTFSLMGDALATHYNLNWNPGQKVFPNAPKQAHLTLLPLFTIGDVPVNWDSNIPNNNNPRYRSAFILFADNGIAPSESTLTEVTTRSAALSGMAKTDQDTSQLAADILVEGLLRYCLNALPRPSSVLDMITAGQLADLIDQLAEPETVSSGFSISNLATFFETNINLLISGDPGGQPDEKGAMALPFPPFLNWKSSQAGDVNFMDKNPIGPWYEWGIAQQLGSYFPIGANAGKKPDTDNPDQYESFTSYMFRDFCLMIAQNAVKEIQKHMDNSSVSAKEQDGQIQSLSQIAQSLPTTTITYTIQSGDTITSVAEALGATVQELEFLNPALENDLESKDVGTLLSIILGIAPEVLALDNADQAFAITQCDLGTVRHQAGSGQSLHDIAALFQVSDVASLLSYVETGSLPLNSDLNLLQDDASFDLQARTFSSAPDDFNVTRVAAVFFTRYTNPDLMPTPASPDMAAWYAQAIAEKNATKLSTLFPQQEIPTDIELPPNQTLDVPDKYNNKSVYNTYTTVAGDTLLRIGTALVLQQDFPDTSPPSAPNWQDFLKAVSSDRTHSWTIPAQEKIVIQAGETIVSLSRRMIIDASWTPASVTVPSQGRWTYNWENIADWIGAANVLAPLAMVTVPNAKTAQHDDLSFTLLTQIYGLSIIEAATTQKDVPGLYATTTSLTVKHLPAQNIETLISAALKGASFTAIANQASRMLLAGLQLPALDTTSDKPHAVPSEIAKLPLYDLTGQQFDLTVVADKPDETALSLTVKSSRDWITFMDSITVQTGQTFAQLQALYPNITEYNPGLTATNLKAGQILLTGPVNADGLDFSYTNLQVQNNSPATGLSIVPIPATPPHPSALALSGTAPRTYGLEHRIDLQTPVALAIPAPETTANVSGLPSMWLFPEDFLKKAKQGVTTPYEILSATRGGAAGSQANALVNSNFACTIPFRLSRLDDGMNHFSLLGVDTDQRHLLLAIRSWLQANPTDTKTEAHLMLAPAPNATNASGLTVLAANADDIYLIKTNLSTESAPQPPENMFMHMAETTPPEQVYFAKLSSLADFLLLLWEGSVVGGTGYYLNIAQQLPGSAVDQNGYITLQLLVIAGSQQALAPNGRTLFPFNNCALVGPGLDPAYHSLFIESHDDSDTITQALVPPGNIGFELLIDNPDSSGDTSPENEKHLKDLYSLLSFEVAKRYKTGTLPASPYIAPPSGMPVTPHPSDGDTQQIWQQHRKTRRDRQAGLLKTDNGTGTEAYWKYQQVIPIYKFVRQSVTEACPNVIGLPIPATDPYHGMGTQTQLPSAEFIFGFADLLGNRTAPPNAPQGITELSVGYTDTMIGISEWPAIASYFEVDKANGSNDAVLSAMFSLRPAELLPTPSQAGNNVAIAATQYAQKYRQIYYQIKQPNLTAWLVSSLHLIPDTDMGNKGIQINDIDPLWYFAAGAYAHANTVTRLKAAEPTGTPTLADVKTKYGIRYTELAYANADLLVQSLFGPVPLTVPAFFPFVEHDSINTLFNRPPRGWPKPAKPEDLLTDTHNTILPLKIGTALIIPTRNISTGSIQPTAKLADLATSAGTTTTYLFNNETNQTAPILETGFEFVVELDNGEEIKVTVSDANNSFTKIVQAYADQGINLTAAGLAELHKDKTGLFAINKNLLSTHYIVKSAETLADNGSGHSVAELASNNVDTPDVFDPRALIHFGNFANVNYGDTPPTLRQFADRYACPIEQMLTANSGISIPAESELKLPGIMAWPETITELRIPYTVQATDKLVDIAARFAPASSEGAADLALAQANEAMPGTLRPDTQITVNVAGQQVQITTGKNESFAMALQQVKAQAAGAKLSDLVTAISDKTDILNTGALLLCAPAKLPQACQPADIKTLYGINPGYFTLANSATEKLIVAGLTLYSTDGKNQITTQAEDTFNTLITRFAEQNVQIDAAEITNAEKNQTVAFMAKDVLALLPPAPIQFDANIGQGGPYPAPTFPLDVSLRIIRPHALIYPDFQTPENNGPVEMVESAIPASTRKSAPGDDSGLTFDHFVAMLTTALPKLRVATGKVEGVDRDLWCVDFDANGISSVALTGATTIDNKKQPRFFALAPLYSHLVTRTGLEIAPLAEDGKLGTTVLINYQSVDSELWARRFLTDFDNFLTGPYAVALYKDPTNRAQLSNVLQVKDKLIPLIAAGLSPILEVSEPNQQAALDNAQRALQQQLGINLSKTYMTSAVIQYDSIVQSAWQQTGSTLKPAALYGDGSIEGSTANVTIISAKAHLETADSFVNFLMTVDQPAHHREVKGCFEYDVSHIEFNISDAGLPDKYVASDWLSFVPPLNKDNKPTALQQTDPHTPVDVPIPLRTFPGLPIIKGQTATGFSERITSIEQFALWSYALTYSHQHAEQDYVVITAEFNLHKPKTNALMVEANRDLFTELAQYNTVADELWDILNGLIDPKSGAIPGTISNAIETFATLAGNISQYWPTRISQNDETKNNSDDLVAGNSYSFYARVSYRNDQHNNSEIASYALTRLDATPGPNNTWPDVTTELPDGSTIQFTPGSEENGKMIYTVDAEKHIPANSWPVFILSWDSLNVAAFQNARAKVHVERNQNLLKNKDIPTNKKFLFKSAEVMSNGLVTPLLNSSERYQISGTDPGKALNSALDALFPTAQRLPDLQLNFGLGYSYELVPNPTEPDKGLTSLLPVALYPSQTLSSSIGEHIQTALTNWQNSNHPNTTGGEWAFSLMLYSAMEESPRPLLILDKLFYKIE